MERKVFILCALRKKGDGREVGGVEGRVDGDCEEERKK